MQWSEDHIAKAIAHQLFQRSVLIVPRCHWAGSECDLLVITKDLRIIDVEIKISRADLKADINKDKWWIKRPWSRRHEAATPRQWPNKTWKHYYVMPATVWEEKLYDTIPAVSGIILLAEQRSAATPLVIRLIRKAKANKEAQPICPQDAVDIARLASLRMWAALCK